MIVAVAHQEFRDGSGWNSKICKVNSVLYDLKYIFDICESDMRL